MSEENTFLKERNLELERRIAELEAEINEYAHRSKQILENLINELSLPNDTTLENLSSSIKKYVHDSISEMSSLNQTISQSPSEENIQSESQISFSMVNNTKLGQMQSEIDKLKAENAQLKLTNIQLTREKNHLKQNQALHDDQISNQNQQDF